MQTQECSSVVTISTLQIIGIAYSCLGLISDAQGFMPRVPSRKPAILLQKRGISKNHDLIMELGDTGGFGRFFPINRELFMIYSQL